MDQDLIKRAIAFIQDLFRTNTNGHDVDHTMRVYKNAMSIAENEPDCDLELVALAALFHDVDDHKLFNTRDNANARRFLEGTKLPPSRVDQVCELANSVSFSQNQGRPAPSLEGKIVQDADRLDAIGAIGISRVFAYGGGAGKPIKESIQHFYDKLLRLKDLMNTETAKKEAEGRHQVMVDFLEEYFTEIESTGSLGKNRKRSKI